jgi:hypothetical protein
MEMECTISALIGTCLSSHRSIWPRENADDEVQEVYMKKITIAVALILLLASCTTIQEIKRPDGTTEYLIACGASLGWNICYDKANQVCPWGYTTLSEDAGFNRKELRITCPSAKKTTQ